MQCSVSRWREYGHNTIVPTFLASPIRHRAALAQLAPVATGGGVLSLIGAGLTVGAVAIALPTTDYGFLVSTTNVIRVLAAAGFAPTSPTSSPAPSTTSANRPHSVP